MRFVFGFSVGVVTGGFLSSIGGMLVLSTGSGGMLRLVFGGDFGDIGRFARVNAWMVSDILDVFISLAIGNRLSTDNFLGDPVSDWRYCGNVGLGAGLGNLMAFVVVVVLSFC